MIKIRPIRKTQGRSLKAIVRAAVDEEMVPELMERVERAAEFLAADARKAVGRQRRRAVKLTAEGKRGLGVPPAMISGELQRSIQAGKAERTARMVRAPWGSDLKQAGRLEFGGRDRTGRYIPPHSFMRYTQNRRRGPVRKILEGTA
jgi:hypothetical protein